MSEYLSYRQVGREFSGRIYRGSLIDAYNRATYPSIPSSNDKVLSQSPRKSGFGSASSRFQLPSLNQSPISYTEASNVLNPSHSKKGFGGLTRKESRFRRFQYNSVAPGPGRYDPISPIKHSSVKFVKPSDMKLLSNSVDIPAPGHYEPKVSSNTRIISSIFKSTSKRHIDIKDDTPSSWEYDPNKHISSTKNNPSHFFQATKHKIKVNVYDPHDTSPKNDTPGPGSYTFEHKTMDSRPSYMFLKKNREKKTKSEVPGPGHYDILKDGNSSNLVSGAVFMSDSERRWLSLDSRAPGPAFYHPQHLPNRRSFLFNPHKNWC